MGQPMTNRPTYHRTDDEDFSDISDVDHLTIGIIARNGLPFLNDCLAALPSDWETPGNLDIILVDCISNDGTTAVMLEFAARRNDARVYRIDGLANAAVARNIVLDHSAPGYVLLLDGDMVLSRTYLATAIAHIRRGDAEAITGSLREQQFDIQNQPLGDEIWRLPPLAPHYVRVAGGAILLGPRAFATGCRYDERLRFGEDLDFALRLSEIIRILRIPDNLGAHLTYPYFGPNRWPSYFGTKAGRIFGTLVRQHLRYPSRMARLISGDRGTFLGLGIQALILLGLLIGQTWLTLAMLMVLLIDFIRKMITSLGTLRSRAIGWVIIRLVEPPLLVSGLFYPEYATVSYTVDEIG
jgi:glycosyltransferase involved in cell wall biosynthesis